SSTSTTDCRRSRTPDHALQFAAHHLSRREVARDSLFGCKNSLHGREVSLFRFAGISTRRACLLRIFLVGAAWAKRVLRISLINSLFQGISRSAFAVPTGCSRSSVIYFRCADMALAVRELRARGVTFVAEPSLIAEMEDHDLWMAF